VTERAQHAHHDRPAHCPAILEREHVHRTSDVGIAAVGREDAAAHDDVTQRAGERGQPRGGTFPRHRACGQVLHDPIDFDDRLEQRRSITVHEARATGKLHRGARSPVQHPHRMNGTIRGMDARQGKPVIARHLPGNVRKRCVCHVVVPVKLLVQCPNDSLPPHASARTTSD